MKPILTGKLLPVRFEGIVVIPYFLGSLIANLLRKKLKVLDPVRDVS